MTSPFSCHGLDAPETPVLISVPHAGRNYPAEMKQLSRLSIKQLQVLEDRHSDLLAADAARAGHGLIINNTARAWIDLNRAESELDPSMFSAGTLPVASVRQTSKVRGGLGIIPRRLAQAGEVWRSLITADDFGGRLDQVHRPYHVMVEAGLQARRRKFGAAVLIDLHSMPSLRPSRGETAPQMVIGDFYGKAAAFTFVEAAMAELVQAGFVAALNQPYAGGHMLDRHGNPGKGIHALQIEIDRSLYLDANSDMPGAGAPTISRLVARIADALAQEACHSPYAIAAE